MVGGKSYPMPCHGFAKTQPWKEIARSADDRGAQVTVELTDTENTRQFYPFSFKVDATYLLSNAQLTITYAVTSDPSNKQDMPFSVGNHIGFKIPFVEGTDPADMTLETPNTTQLLHNPTGAGLSGEKVLRSFETPQKLGDFDSRVAIALAGYRSQPYAVLSDPQGVSVRVTQSASSSLSDPLVRFNIYGGPHEGYLCPEPWFGIQNSLNQHKGMIALPAGQSWKWRLQIVASGPPPSMSTASPGVERYGSNFGYVEGPVWSRKGYLLFSDMFGSRIIKMTASNRTEIYRDYTNAANGNSMDVQGRLYSRMMLVLAASVGVFGGLSGSIMSSKTSGTPGKPQPGTSQNVPAEYQSGISALQGAKSALEKAGDKWGGHRVKAIHQIRRGAASAGAESVGKLFGNEIWQYG